MAQKTVVHYVDDISGEPADETVRFGLDRSAYDIDLSVANAKQLRDVLAPFVEAARKIPAGRAPRGAAPAKVDREQRDAVRAWARANGHPVGSRGRIPELVLIAYNQAH